MEDAVHCGTTSLSDWWDYIWLLKDFGPHPNHILKFQTTIMMKLVNLVDESVCSACSVLLEVEQMLTYACLF